MTLGVPCIESVNRNGKSFLFIFSIFNLFPFRPGSRSIVLPSVFINLDEADFHKTFFDVVEERKRKFIKSAIKMISTSLFHPLIFSSFYSFAHPLLRFGKNALNTQFFSLLFSVIILFRHHESLTSLS
jgi:hypothetical protein